MIRKPLSTKKMSTPRNPPGSDRHAAVVEQHGADRDRAHTVEGGDVRQSAVLLTAGSAGGRGGLRSTPWSGPARTKRLQGSAGRGRRMRPASHRPCKRRTFRSYGGAGPVRPLGTTPACSRSRCARRVLLPRARRRRSRRQPLALNADPGERGWIGADARAAPGRSVTVTEDGAPLATVTAAAAATRCRARRPGAATGARASFVATAADGRTAPPRPGRRRAATGSRSTRPGARGRAAAMARPRPRPLGPRRPARAVCVRPPGGPVRCRERAPGTGCGPRLRAPRPGEWRAARRARRGSERRAASASRGRGGRQRLLVTGRLDDPAARRLPRAARCAPHGVRVTSDPQISTGISKPTLLDWPAHARRAGRPACAPTSPSCCSAPTTASRSAPSRRAAATPWVARVRAPRGRGMMAHATRAAAAGACTGSRCRRRAAASSGGRSPRSTRRCAARRRDEPAARAADPARPLLHARRPLPRHDADRRPQRPAVRQADGVHLSSAGAAAAARSSSSATLRRERIVG